MDKTFSWEVLSVTPILPCPFQPTKLVFKLIISWAWPTFTGFQLVSWLGFRIQASILKVKKFCFEEMEPKHSEDSEIGENIAQGQDLTLEFVLIASVAAICIILFAVYIKVSKNEVMSRIYRHLLFIKYQLPKLCSTWK